MDFEFPIVTGNDLHGIGMRPPRANRYVGSGSARRQKASDATQTVSPQLTVLGRSGAHTQTIRAAMPRARASFTSTGGLFRFRLFLDRGHDVRTFQNLAFDGRGFERPSATIVSSRVACSCISREKMRKTTR